VDIEYVADGKIRYVSVELPSLPGAEHTYEKPEWEFRRYVMTDTWRSEGLDTPWTYRLRTKLLYQSIIKEPVVTPDNLRISLEVEY